MTSKKYKADRWNDALNIIIEKAKCMFSITAKQTFFLVMRELSPRNVST